MKTGVIPDIHDLCDKAQGIMDREPGIDQWVLLGDYFDSWTGTATDAMHTAKRLSAWLDDPRIICLLGNHDQSYALSGADVWHRCSGWTLEKHVVINSEITKGEWAKLRAYAVFDGWLMTHAGLDRRLIGEHDPLDVLTAFDTWLTGVLADPFKPGTLRHSLLDAGRDRSGRADVGGITWVGWETLKPPPGLNQIVGHTYARDNWRIKSPKTTGDPVKAYCLDTGLRHYGIIDDGHLEVRRT